MAFPTSTTDIIVSAYESRRKDVRDGARLNNALFAVLEEKAVDITGGNLILEELSYAANQNAMFYSGWDPLAINAADVIGAAQYTLKQAACFVVISKLEQLQNSGPEKVLDLLDKRLEVAESSLYNILSQGAYSDGTIFNGRAIVGLGALIVANPAVGVVGGIDPAVWPIWRNQVGGPGNATTSATNIQGYMNTLYAKCSRGKDVVDLIAFDNNLFGFYEQSLQVLQRFAEPTGAAKLGFQAYKYKGAEVVLDGGVGGFMPVNTGYFINSKYLYYRPHKDANIEVDKTPRAPLNQDGEATLIRWAGAMTASLRHLHGLYQA